MSTYFIAPFEPLDKPQEWEILVSSSGLLIEPSEYSQRLLQRWPHTQIQDEVSDDLLVWTIFEYSNSVRISRGTGNLQSNAKIVAHSSPYVEFFLWHRETTPGEHRLWLFSDASWNSLELKQATTTQMEIQHFLSA